MSTIKSSDANELFPAVSSRPKSAVEKTAARQNPQKRPNSEFRRLLDRNIQDPKSSTGRSQASPDGSIAREKNGEGNAALLHAEQGQEVDEGARVTTQDGEPVLDFQDEFIAGSGQHESNDSFSDFSVPGIPALVSGEFKESELEVPDAFSGDDDINLVDATKLEEPLGEHAHVVSPGIGSSQPTLQTDATEPEFAETPSASTEEIPREAVPSPDFRNGSRVVETESVSGANPYQSEGRESAPNRESSFIATGEIDWGQLNSADSQDQAVEENRPFPIRAHQEQFPPADGSHPQSQANASRVTGQSIPSEANPTEIRPSDERPLFPEVSFDDPTATRDKTTSAPVDTNTTQQDRPSSFQIPPRGDLTQTSGKANQARSENLQPTHTESIIEQTGASLVNAIGGGKSIRMRLNPPELGILNIEVTSLNGQMTARLDVENVQAHRVLFENLSQLQDLLSRTHTQVDRIELHMMESHADSFSSSQYQGSSFSFGQRGQEHELPNPSEKESGRVENEDGSQSHNSRRQSPLMQGVDIQA